MRRFAHTGLCLGFLFCSANAQADPARPPPAPTPTPSSAMPAVSADSTRPGRSKTRPDIVRLKDGGMVRGVIDEKVPGEYVVITTPSGSSRRFPWSDVSYAGE